MLAASLFREKIFRIGTKSFATRSGNMIRTRFLLLCGFSIIVMNWKCDSAVQPLFGSADPAINITNDGTTETHHTMCRITTERLVANAQATFTRVLTGACNAKTIDERFEKLENLMNKRLDEIKGMIARGKIEEWTFSTFNNDYKNKRIPDVNSNWPDGHENEYESRKINSQPRRHEIERYNNSIHDISTLHDQQKVYTYYWRVLNVGEKLLQWETGRSERSSTFYVGDDGYAMYLRFTPKYFPDGTIFISVGLTRGVHDSQLVWPFPLRIRIEILDLAAINEPEDRSSRIWDPATVCSSHFWGRPGTIGGLNNPECVGLSLPRQLLLGEQTKRSSSFNDSSYMNGKYVVDDSLLIKLSIHLS